MDDATQAQNRAAQPTVSTWLTANAGSGKTRVLTNRVARLLLNGVEPESILCLTYTTAAASEMQNRLFETLGAWAMLKDEALHDALTKLGERDVGDLARARTLFASAIEAPGGLKIQTIHSFCSKILRQFPLEAGVNPKFREIDESAQSDLIRTVIETIANDKPHVLSQVQRAYSGEAVQELARDIAKLAERFSTTLDRAEIFQAFDLSPNETVNQIVESAISSGDIVFLKSLIPVLLGSGRNRDASLAQAFMNLPAHPDHSALAILEASLLTKGDAANPFTCKLDVPTKNVRKSAPFAPILPQFHSIGERIERARQRRIALENAEYTHALHAFAHAFLPRYQAAKGDAGVLDFDDLIQRTKQLLTTRSLHWVLYRLDARIDHVLVDEAQDTSPSQWDIIKALTEEMIAGDTGRNRTLFVVGDKKQSIYSFQGADAAGFDARGTSFGEQLKSGPGMVKGELLHSFRSSPAILDVVDSVFAHPDGTGSATRHRAFHDAMPGRVDLWPLVERTEKEPEQPWYDISQRTVDSDAQHQLAFMIAEYVKAMLEIGTIQGKNGQSRRIRPGDIMVLVQRRSALFDKIISACKSHELPIAGADRLKVGSELAVRDVLALLSFLALPDDDLSLAAALRSPIFGWSEGDLYNLAANRAPKTFLWQELRRRRAEFPETYDSLTLLRERVDFARPYELIHRILTRHHGRKRLLERLGPEAEDGIDELVNQALRYEATHVPSLTGFLAVAQASEITVKRETETSGNLIRVMTVHGAKGLESPIVVLPDTTFARPRNRQTIINGPQDIATLSQASDKCTPQMQSAKEAQRDADAAERDRLLYVAMTRAEKWLIVCGVRPAQDSGDRLNWHRQVEQGIDALAPETLSTPAGIGRRYSVGHWPEDDRITELETESDPEPVNLEALGALPYADVKDVRSPSKLGGEKVLGGGSGEENGGARKGRQMHVLLEHLPGSSDPRGLAAALLAQGPDAASLHEVDALVSEAKSIIATHERLFRRDTLAEVDISAFSPTLGAQVAGAIDRLVVDEARILAVDFKTNAHVPQHPGDTPDGILRQMGAYLEALEAVFPQREVDVAILWTATGKFMLLKHGIVREALSRATTS